MSFVAVIFFAFPLFSFCLFTHTQNHIHTTHFIHISQSPNRWIALCAARFRAHPHRPLAVGGVTGRYLGGLRASPYRPLAVESHVGRYQDCVRGAGVGSPCQSSTVHCVRGAGIQNCPCGVAPAIYCSGATFLGLVKNLRENPRVE